MTDNVISRTLSDGWDYRPDWRAAIIDEKLKSKPHASLAELCRDESDSPIRLALRFLKLGTGASSAAVQWASNCHKNRAKNTSSAIVEAMTIAGCDRDEIAFRIGTTPLSITFYQKLYFDVIRYLDMQEWVLSIAIPADTLTSTNPIQLKARMYLATAFHHGSRGLDRLMTGTIPKNAAQLEQLTNEIRAAATVRAHEAMLQCMLTSSGSEDMARFIEFGRLPVAQGSSKQQEKLQTFGENIRKWVMCKDNESDTATRAQSLGDASVYSDCPQSSAESFSRC